MRYYRYLATDAAGSYAILSYGPAEGPSDDTVELRLLEVTEDFTAAYRAHKALEERLRRKPTRRLRDFGPRGPAA